MLFSQLLTDLQYILDERQGQCAFHVLVEISPLLFLSPNIARHDICKSICARTNGQATNNPTWLEFMTLFPPSPNHPQLSLTLPRKHGFRKIEPITCVRLNIRSFHLNTTYSNISASLVITINHSGKGAENALDE